MSASTGDPVKTVVPKSFMASTRIELRSGVRSAMCASSQLSGRGVDVAPLPGLGGSVG